MTLLFATGTLSIGVVFWVFMLLILILGLWMGWPIAPPAGPAWRPLGFNLVLWFLLFLLGWSEFGFPIGR